MSLDNKISKGGIFFLTPERVTTLKASANRVLCDHITYEAPPRLFHKYYPEDLPLNEGDAKVAMWQIGNYTGKETREEYWPFLICESCGYKIHITPQYFIDRRLDVLMYALKNLGGMIHLCVDRKWRLIECNSCRP